MAQRIIGDFGLGRGAKVCINETGRKSGRARGDTEKDTLMNEQNRMFFIKAAYWPGIGADALWAVGLLVPRVFGFLTATLISIPICRSGSSWG
jgi:hypothetical protein